jgi:release factor glutamine methyltransferase
MTVEKLLWAAELQQKKVLEKLICHYMWWSKEELWINIDSEIPNTTHQKILENYNEYVIEKKPLEFIIWHVEFFWFKYKVNENTLIPRPETEYMIEAVNDYMSTQDWPITLIDMWTWCWVLWLTVLKLNQDKINQAFLTEYIDATLNVAMENTKIQFWNDKDNLEKICLLKSNLFDELINQKKLNSDLNVVFVWNLPYIPDETFDTQVEENVKKREPRPAFVWWEDGLFYYREILKTLINLSDTQTISKKKRSLYFEMMTRQQAILEKEFWELFTFEAKKTFHFNIIILECKFK